MKVKLKNIKVPVPSFNSFCDLNTDDWEKLNSGKIVELKEIPKLAKKYVEVINGKS